MEEIGTVVAVEGGTAKIRLLRRGTCEKCGMCGMGQHPEVVVDVPETIGAKPGDRVVLAVEGRNVMRAALAAYAVPVLALLLGYPVSAALLRAAGVTRFHEALSIVGSFLFCAASFFWVRSYDRRAGGRFEPRMLRIAEGSEEPLPPPQGCSSP